MDFLIHLQLKLVCKYWCTTHSVLLQVGYSFSFSLVQMLELGHKEGWELKYWCFWIVVLEKTLKSPLDCEDIKPVSPKGLNTEYSLEGLMLKLKLQYFHHLMWRTNSLEKTLMLGRIEGKRMGWPRMRFLDGLINTMDMNLSKLWETVKEREPRLSAGHGISKSWTWLSDWTTPRKLED